MIHEVLNSLLDLFSPRVCVVCGRILIKGEKHICTHCLLKFPFTDKDFMNCGVFTMYGTDIQYQLYSLFYYNKDSDYHKAIHRLKYGDRPQVGVYLGRMLGERVSQSDETIDVLVPLPLHERRKKWRGYNQAECIARGISEVTDVPVVENVIVRKKNTVSQTGLSAEMRHENMGGVFEIRDKESLKGKHLLVIDDVITTGATMSSCVEALSAIENVSFSIGCLGRTL